MKMNDFYTTVQGVLVSAYNICFSVVLTDVNEYLKTASLIVGLAVGIMTIVKIVNDLSNKKK
jgi:hypothetical protein